MYKIIKFKRYYLIANTDGEYKNHSHISIWSKSGYREHGIALLIVKLVTNKILPTSDYIKVSCRRLTLDEEYKRVLEESLLRSKRNKYNNRR